MQKKGVSTLFVSHKLEEVFEIAEEFTILRNGKKVITTDAASITREKFIFYMTGRQLSEKQFVMNDKNENVRKKFIRLLDKLKRAEYYIVKVSES